MKKLTALMMMGVMAVSVAACGGSGQAASDLDSFRQCTAGDGERSR